MSKTFKPVWIVWNTVHAYGPYETRRDARRFQFAGEKIVKYIPAPVAPKAPKPEPVDIGAVRQEVAEVISVMVTEGKKDVIKSILSTYGVDRARELPDDKVENFLNDLKTPLA